MDYKSVLERFSPLLRKHWLPLALISTAMIFLIYGLISLVFHPGSSAGDTVFEAGSGNQAVFGVATESGSVKTILVDVEGAVVNPGVYHIGADARVKDGLIAAGGLSDAADRTSVAKMLNLAAKLTDGAKIYIPYANAAGSSSSVQSFVSSGNQAAGVVSSQGTININTASESELDALPGIGPVTAQKIISNRPYQVIDDLVSKKAVTQKVFDKIKDQLTTY